MFEMAIALMAIGGLAGILAGLFGVGGAWCWCLRFIMPLPPWGMRMTN
jgi:uncharacterized membrane protein YfcA